MSSFPQIPVAVLVSAALLAGCTEPSGIDESPPNIVLIVIDTLRADSIELDESSPPITPTMRGLADEGVWFDEAFTHTTWTKPAVATIFTSLFPSQHGILTTPEIRKRNRKYYSKVLIPEVETIAERLKEGGYETAGIITQTYMLKNLGFDQGFDYYYATRHKRHPGLNEQLREWAQTRSPEGDRPVYLYLHYLDPHWPYVDRVDELRERLGSLELDPEPHNSGSRLKKWASANGVTPDQARALRARYDHGVGATDRAIGEALTILDEHGLMDDTAILITSDHGEGFWENEKLLHGYAPYDEVHRVPLLVRLPERFGVRPRRSQALVGLVDVMPTILDIAGLEPGSALMGRSLVPIMRRSDPATDRPVFSESGGILSLRTRTHKLIRRPIGTFEFYDLVADPMEQTSLPCDEICEDLWQQLDSLTSVLKPVAESEGEGVELSDEDVEQLRALGYLD